MNVMVRGHLYHYLDTSQCAAHSRNCDPIEMLPVAVAGGRDRWH